MNKEQIDGKGHWYIMLPGICLFGALQKYVRRAKTSKSLQDKAKVIPVEPKRTDTSQDYASCRPTSQSRSDKLGDREPEMKKDGVASTVALTASLAKASTLEEHNQAVTKRLEYEKVPMLC